MFPQYAFHHDLQPILQDKSQNIFLKHFPTTPSGGKFIQNLLQLTDNTPTLKITPTRQKFYTDQLKRWPLQKRKSACVILRANTSKSSCFETASIFETVFKVLRNKSQNRIALIKWIDVQIEAYLRGLKTWSP